MKINIKRIEDQLTGAQQVLREYKKEIECLRQDVSMMDNNLQTLNDENIKEPPDCVKLRAISKSDEHAKK